ncbi:DUF4189 domain-containing protein [Microseira sp. BLCC-F43]|jgi:serine/threonine-protein kinase|uniref:DUF4189 domain-containing protein n=1 Tax=Microseira sp. BLCC-F43 TaxID=3153602 RepID=UPI0035BB56BA
MKKRLGIFALALVLAEGLTGGAAFAALDNYGAIATSDSGAWGYGYNYPTRAQAERAALEECGEAGCEIQVWFKNACGAVAKDGTNLGWAWAQSREEAEANAVSECGTGACQVVTWACTDR